MTVDDIRKVTVVGTGTMGNGIAQVFATKGYEVDMVDIKQEFLDRDPARPSPSAIRVGDALRQWLKPSSSSIEQTTPPLD